jgi:hypothetical protein
MNGDDSVGDGGNDLVKLLFPFVSGGRFRSPQIIVFLGHMLRHIPGKLLIVWDGLPEHRSRSPLSGRRNCLLYNYNYSMLNR